MTGTEFVRVIYVFELLFPTNETGFLLGGKSQQEPLNMMWFQHDDDKHDKNYT